MHGGFLVRGLYTLPQYYKSVIALLLLSTSTERKDKLQRLCVTRNLIRILIATVELKFESKKM